EFAARHPAPSQEEPVHMTARVRLVLISLVWLYSAGTVLAQSDRRNPLDRAVASDASHPFSADEAQLIGQPAGPPPTPPHTGIKAMIKDLGQDIIHLPSRENAMWVGIGGGLALAVHPADDNVTPSLVNSNFADKFFKPGEVLGESP